MTSIGHREEGRRRKSTSNYEHIKMSIEEPGNWSQISQQEKNDLGIRLILDLDGSIRSTSMANLCNYQFIK